MKKISLHTTRRPNYLRAGIKFKDGKALTKEGKTIDAIEVNDSQFEALMRDNNIILKTANDEPADTLSDEEKLEAVKEAIRGLDKKVKENWTAGELPQVSAIEGVVGFMITADLRDQAWEAVSHE